MIYISYGITKSASTYLYQLTEEVFRGAGQKPVRVGPPLRHFGSVDNYFDVIDEKLLSDIARLAGSQPIVLKTHGRPRPEIAEKIAAGEVLAHASIRDPREIALSMLDHGKRARRWRLAPFSEFGNLKDTFAGLDDQLQTFSMWAAIENMAIFTYNDICFDSASVIRRIAEQAGLVVDPDLVLSALSKGAIGQFSKGKALRYTEMSEEEQAAFLERYAAIYKIVPFENENALAVARSQQSGKFRPRGQVAQYIVALRRLFSV